MYESNCVFYIMFKLILPKRVLRNGVLVRGRDWVKVWIGTGTVLGIGIGKALARETPVVYDISV